MKIRPLEIQDIDFVVDSEKLLFGETLGEEMLRKEMNKDVAHYFVIEEIEPIGYIGLWIIGDTAEIINFLIHPNYQNQGYGFKLFDFVWEYMRQLQVKKVSLEVKESNKIAQQLYIKKGFKTVHVRKKYYPDGQDAYLMIGEM